MTAPETDGVSDNYSSWAVYRNAQFEKGRQPMLKKDESVADITVVHLQRTRLEASKPYVVI